MEIRKRGRILPVCVLFCVFALLFIFPSRERSGAQAGFQPEPRLPREIGGWTRTRNVKFGEQVYRMLGTRDAGGAVYRNERGDTVYLVLVRATNNRAAFHPPEYCMEGSGYELRDRRTVPLAAAGITVNEMRFSRGTEEDVLVWNWYASGKSLTSSFYRQQIALLAAQMRGGAARGASVTVYTHLNGGDLAQARQAHTDFTRAFVPCLRTRL